MAATRYRPRHIGLRKIKIILDYGLFLKILFLSVNFWTQKVEVPKTSFCSQKLKNHNRNPFFIWEALRL